MGYQVVGLQGSKERMDAMSEATTRGGGRMGAEGAGWERAKSQQHSGFSEKRTHGSFASLI